MQNLRCGEVFQQCYPKLATYFRKFHRGIILVQNTHVVGQSVTYYQTQGIDGRCDQ